MYKFRMKNKIKKLIGVRTLFKGYEHFTWGTKLY